MKKNLFALCALIAATLALSACGKKNDQNPNIPAPSAQPYQQLGSQPVPLGQYYTGYGYSSCPLGYSASGNMCYPMQGSNGTCPSGQTWNGYGCQPSGIQQCPQGMQYSTQYGMCVGNYNYNQYQWNCSQWNNSSWFPIYQCKPTCPNGSQPQYNGYYWSC